MDPEPNAQRTPLFLYDWLNERFHFDADVAADERNALAPRFYECDSLREDWSIHIKSAAFCNPPYDRTRRWLMKAYAESLRGVTTVLLIPTHKSEHHWHDFIFDRASEVIFLTGRLRFGHSQTGEPNSNYAKFGSAIVIYTPHHSGHTHCHSVRVVDIKNR